MTLSSGVGSFQARPGRVSTRDRSPKRVITEASPAPTMTEAEANTAAATMTPANAKRSATRSATRTRRPGGRRVLLIIMVVMVMMVVVVVAVQHWSSVLIAQPEGADPGFTRNRRPSEANLAAGYCVQVIERGLSCATQRASLPDAML